jgi:hypothetical protein
VPLSIEFLSVETGEPAGSQLTHAFEHLNLSNIDIVPIADRDKLKPLIVEAIKERSYFPIAMAIENSSPSGIRNIYIELDIDSSSTKLEITESPLTGLHSMFKFYTTLTAFNYPSVRTSRIKGIVEQKLARFDADKIQATDRGWRLSFEWEAIQPQRVRLIKPIFYVYSPESAKLSFKARIFADSFPEPFILVASATIEVKQSTVDLVDLMPDWETRLVQLESTTTVAFEPQ